MDDLGQTIIVSIFSAVIGAIIVNTHNIPSIFRNIKNRWKDDVITGTWHTYHFTYMKNEIIISSYTWNIRKGIIKQFIVDIESEMDKRLNYSGFMSRERGNFIAELSGSSPDIEDIAFFRIHNPIMANDKKIIGIWSAIDFNGTASAGPLMLSKNEMTDDDVKKFIIDNINFNEDHRLIKFKY